MAFVSGEIALGVSVRGEGGIAGEGRNVGIPKFHSWGKYTMPLTLRLNVQHFLWPVYYISQTMRIL